MSRWGRGVLLSWLGLVMLPALAAAQGEIAGIVKDTSGAVLPGVTVEAASPVLIEKVRSVVTDGTGRYRIIDLRPGSYTVTFTLPGFATVKRDGVVLTGSAILVVDADLRVGSVEETITVTGETPLVDVQSTTRQQVLSDEVIDALPTARSFDGLARLVPGVTPVAGIGARNVGNAMGAGGGGGGHAMTFHGTRPQDTRITLNGISTMTLQAGGALGGPNPDSGSAQEVAIDTSAVSAELPTGGLRINYIPRDGGNTFSMSTFATFSHEDLQGSNFTDRVKNMGLTTPDRIKKNWDLNPAFGGPLRKNTLWFWFSGRYTGAETYMPLFENKNAFNLTQWLYDQDTNRPGVEKLRASSGHVRLTWQATPRNKVAGTFKPERYCRCPNFLVDATAGLVAPDSAPDRRFPRMRQEHLEWTSPVTSRLMFEVVGMHLFERWGNMHPRVDDGSLDDAALQAVVPQLISVTEQSTGVTYRMRAQFNNTVVPNYAYRAAVSYVPGAHAFKFGWNMTHGYVKMTIYDFQPISYRFNNGVPNQITLRATPYTARSHEDADVGLFAQDRWTIKRATVSLAARFDYFKTSFPEQYLGAGLLVPTRDITFPAQDNLNWKDFTYRTGVSYDVRGDGKTAVKVSFNKYLRGQTLNGLGSTPNPVNAMVTSTTRTWTDRNANYVADCALTNPVANGECGAMANANFGKTVPQATFDPDLVGGWGNREYNYEFSAGVQHQVLPRVSVDVGYFRRVWGNFQVTDNLAVEPTDFDYFSITAPAHASLPDGGGYTVSGLRNVKPAKFGQVLNYNTLADKYGKQTDHWNGVDVSVNARLQNGLLVQGGFSTGRTTEDNCEVAAKLPEADLSRSLTDCKRETPFLLNAKAYAVYTLPRIDVQVAGTFYSYPGPVIAANYNAPNAVVSPSLGRTLSGGTPNTLVNLLQEGRVYGERLNQVDLRVGKVLRFGRSRANVSVDVYNLTNEDTVQELNNNFGAWLQPTALLLARFVKFSVQFDF